MKMYLMAGVCLLTLGACAQPVTLVCDRERQEWTKVGTEEDMCDGDTHVVRSTVVRDRGDGERRGGGRTSHGVDRDGGDTGTGGGNAGGGGNGDDGGSGGAGPDAPSDVRGNPGNNKPVGRAGENPNGRGGWGKGDRGMSR